MPNVKLRPVLLLTATLWLSACVTAPSEPSVCPHPVEYSPEFQARLADELMALPNNSAMVRAMIDYGRLRAELRACR